MIQYFHNSISLIYLLSTLYILFRSFRAWQQRFSWTKRDVFVSRTVVVAMYIQLFLGLYLFFSARYFQSGTTLNTSTEMRFWPIEHFFIMIFALLTAQIGLIIASNTKEAHNKHRAIFLYNLIAMLLVFVSLIMIFLYR